MKTISRWMAVGGCAMALLVASGSAFATNGMWLIGYGARSRGMGGTGIAFAQGGMAAAFNPATMTAVKSDIVLSVGAALFNPPRAAAMNSSTLPTSAKSGANLFLIPSMGAVVKVGNRLAVGLAVVGAGLGTRYDQTVAPGQTSNFFNFNGWGACPPGTPGSSCPNPHGQSTLGINLMQVQMLPSVAYKVIDSPQWGEQTIGASFVGAIQTFRAYGLQGFEKLGYTSSSKYLTNEGNDWSYGWGFRVGWLGRFFDERLSVGVTGASRVYMSKFTKYRNLFAEHGDFDIPPWVGFGIAYKVTPRLVVTADAEKIFWHSVKAIGNPGPNNPTTFFPPGYGKLGADNGIGFGWQNQKVFKFGVQYQLNEKFTVRGGYNFGATPISSTQVLFNMLAPATVEKHLTLGLTYSPTPSIDLSFDYMHAFAHTVSGKTPFYPQGVNTAAQLTADNAAIRMKENSFGFSFAYRM